MVFLFRCFLCIFCGFSQHSNLRGIFQSYHELEPPSFFWTCICWLCSIMCCHWHLITFFGLGFWGMILGSSFLFYFSFCLLTDSLEFSINCWSACAFMQEYVFQVSCHLPNEASNISVCFTFCFLSLPSAREGWVFYTKRSSTSFCKGVFTFKAPLELGSDKLQLQFINQAIIFQIVVHSLSFYGI